MVKACNGCWTLETVFSNRGGRLMFTRRHFIGIARLLGSIEAEQDLAESFCEFFQAHNDAFDKAKFMWEIDDAWGKEWEMPK